MLLIAASYATKIERRKPSSIYDEATERRIWCHGSFRDLQVPGREQILSSSMSMQQIKGIERFSVVGRPREGHCPIRNTEVPRNPLNLVSCLGPVL